VEQSEEAKKMN